MTETREGQEVEEERVNHDARFWAWKYERREAECEELAERIRGLEQAIKEEAARLKDNAEDYNAVGRDAAYPDAERKKAKLLARHYASCFRFAEAALQPPNPTEAD